MKQHARWVVLVLLVALAGCAKQDEKKPAEQAQTSQPPPAAQQEELPGGSEPQQPPEKREADERRQIPSTTTASSGQPPRVEPDPQSDRAARGEVATSTAPSTSAATAAQTTTQPSAPTPTAQPSAPASAPAETAKPAAQKQQPMPAKPIVLKDGALGAITFQHATHKFECATCHHPSREAKPLTQPQQACTSCHTKPPQAGMKTARQAAFHDPRGQTGTCIDCHKKSGGKAPVKCADCHKKA